MAVGIQIKIDSKEAQRKLKHLVNLLDVRELLQAIGNRHIRWMNDNLRQAGLDKKHKTMAKSTIAARPKRTSSRHFSSHYQSVLSQSMVVKIIGAKAVLAGTEAEFAELHQEGTQPYTISPKSKKLLRFITENGVVFARKVHHPGIPARPLIPTKQTAERLALDTLNAAYKLKTKAAGVS